MLGISRNQFAAEVGVTSATIRHHLKRKLSGALLPDGSIDPEVARAAWAEHRFGFADQQQLTQLRHLVLDLAQEAHRVAYAELHKVLGVVHREGLRKCKRCGEEFRTPIGSHRRYCSRQCSAKDVAGLNKVFKTCPHCGTRFHGKTGNKHCSDACYKASVRYPRRPCAVCGGAVKKAEGKYCSNACRAQGARRSFIGPPYIWVPSKPISYHIKSLPSRPTPGEVRYFNPNEICSRGHIAPRRLKSGSGRWECVCCQVIDRRPA